MSWFLNNNILTEIPTDAIGFVYCITRISDQKKYIGKKNFWIAVTKPPLKGKTRKRRSKKESDWKFYWGSNTELQSDVASMGEDKFQREILYLCKTKSEMSYYESKEQFIRDVLLRDDYYNGWISTKITRAHLKSLL